MNFSITTSESIPLSSTKPVPEDVLSNFCEHLEGCLHDDLWDQLKGVFRYYDDYGKEVLGEGLNETEQDKLFDYLKEHNYEITVKAVKQ